MIERIAIDTACHRVREEPALPAGEGKSICYTESCVQDAVRRAFGDLLPMIRKPQHGLPYYENFDEESRETCCLTRHATSVRELPVEEVRRLAEGWRRLQRASQDPELVPELRRLLVGFQLPNPVTEIHLYRLYEDSSGRRRLHVFWGYGERDDGSAPMPAGEVIAHLCDRMGLAEAAARGPDPDTVMRKPTALVRVQPTLPDQVRGVLRQAARWGRDFRARLGLRDRIRLAFSRLKANFLRLRERFWKRNDGNEEECSRKLACSRN